jgi:hypothetical protein
MTNLTLRPRPGDPLGIVGQLDAADERARSIAGGLTDGQGAWRPRATSTSVAASLMRYLSWLRRTVPVLRGAVHGVRSGWRARLGEVRSGVWWSLVPRLAEHSPILPLGEAGARAECACRPVRSIMGEILLLHGEVRRLAREGEVRDLRTASVRLTPRPSLRMPIDVALALVPAMARRHLRRAERVRLDARFPMR